MSWKLPPIFLRFSNPLKSFSREKLLFTVDFSPLYGNLSFIIKSPPISSRLSSPLKDSILLKLFSDSITKSPCIFLNWFSPLKFSISQLLSIKSPLICVIEFKTSKEVIISSLLLLKQRISRFPFICLYPLSPISCNFWFPLIEIFPSWMYDSCSTVIIDSVSSFSLIIFISPVRLSPLFSDIKKDKISSLKPLVCGWVIHSFASPRISTV